MKYLTLSKLLGLLLMIVAINSCKNTNKSEKNKSITINKDSTEILNTEEKDSSFSLEYLQGIWTSYSYYLEHEAEDKDEHINEYYKVVVDNNCLDIIIKEHFIDDIILKTYNIGFTDNEEYSYENSKTTVLSTKGSVFIRSYKKIYSHNKIDDIDKLEMSKNYSMDIDMYNTFEDGFKYCFHKNDKKETVQFRKINALPHEVFCKIKEISNIYNIDFIKKYKLKTISRQIKVITQKAHFYNEMNENSRKKAFLIKNDLAYLEDIEEEWVKVYYDGKVVTNGYVKMNEVQIINQTENN